MKYILLSALSIYTIMFFTQCKKEIDDPIITPSSSIYDLTIPEGFNYKTSKKVAVYFSDFKFKPSNFVKYDIYLYDEDQNTQSVSYQDETGQQVTQMVPITNRLNNRLATRITDQTNFEMSFTIPTYISKLYIVRNEMGMFSSAIVPINHSKARYDRSAFQGNSKSNVDVLYGVNGGGDLFTIDHSTGSMTIISSLPDNTGSFTCAINPVNKTLFTVGHNKNLYKYDLDNASWSNVGNLGYSGPRLGYNRTDGLLYFSTSNKLYKVDPSNANILATYTINGMQSYSGGDVTFDASGVMYISSQAGLYRCSFADNNQINTVWISAQSLPNYPNSLTFDSNDELWWATVASNNGRVFIMDKVTGGWQDMFTPYVTHIHDLATLPYDPNNVPQTDSDNDGVIDFYDEFPNDPDVASTSYTPSVYGWGTYAFEDLWPDQGDYDFNDLVINYRYTNYENSSGKVVKSKLAFRIKNVGGSYRNGFGLSTPLVRGKIRMVTGYNLTENIVRLDGTGLETGQSKAVIIPFDNAWNNFDPNDTMNIIVEYNQPLPPEDIGDYNAFMFIDGQRGREVHMAGFAPTDLCDESLFGTADDNTNPDNSTYYKTAANLPWGIDIIHDFTHPKEKKQITLGYAHFATWAQSGGSQIKDWYKEKSGYRNTSYLTSN